MFFRRRKHAIEGDSLEELLESAGLGDRYEALADEEVPAVWLRTESVEDATIAVGDSKLGGHPDLPEGMAWPRNGGRSLEFVAQLRLLDLAGLPGVDSLPAAGHLYFFFDEQRPDDVDAGRVWYVDGDELCRVPVPGDARVLPACRVTAAAKTTIPDVTSIEVEELVLSNMEMDDYVEMSQVYAARFPGPEHQLLGHAVHVDGEMRLQLAFESLPEDAAPEEITAELVQDATSWRLLLQLDSDHDAGMSWGDGGVLYFWIHEEDLAKGDFSAAAALLRVPPEAR